MIALFGDSMQFKNERDIEEIEDIIDNNLRESALKLAREKHAAQHKGEKFTIEVVDEPGLPKKMDGHLVEDANKADEHQDASEGHGGHSIKHSKGWVCCTQCGWHQSVDQVLGYGLDVEGKKSDDKYAGEDEPKEGYSGKGHSSPQYGGKYQGKKPHY